MLARLSGAGLLRAGGRQRTDSTHVLAAVRTLNRMEFVGETLRAALEALAAAAPGWLAPLIDAGWADRYGARIDYYRFPKGEDARERWAGQAGRAGRAIDSECMSVAEDLQMRFPDAAALAAALDGTGYLAGDALSTALFLAVRMGQPILLEGEPGVGKTEAAKALAAGLGTTLVRLQCYEGIAAAEALYEWNYPRQLLAIRLAETTGEALRESDLFTDDYLLARPLLAALDHPGPLPAVLLIDEIDRADDEFEAFLFELLAESAVTIPELGTRRATVPPVVVLTSNRTRDLHDALKRRCLYHWIGYPGPERVAAIIRRRVPGASDRLAGQVAESVRRLRGLDLTKPPGIAEAVNWATALGVFGETELSTASAERTLSTVLKYSEDEEAVRRAGLATLVVPSD